MTYSHMQGNLYPPKFELHGEQSGVHAVSGFMPHSLRCKAQD